MWLPLPDAHQTKMNHLHISTDAWNKHTYYELLTKLHSMHVYYSIPVMYYHVTRKLPTERSIYLKSINLEGCQVSGC